MKYWTEKDEEIVLLYLTTRQDKDYEEVYKCFLKLTRNILRTFKIEEERKEIILYEIQPDIFDVLVTDNYEYGKSVFNFFTTVISNLIRRKLKPEEGTEKKPVHLISALDVKIFKVLDSIKDKQYYQDELDKDSRSIENKERKHRMAVINRFVAEELLPHEKIIFHEYFYNGLTQKQIDEKYDYIGAYTYHQIAQIRKRIRLEFGFALDSKMPKLHCGSKKKKT
jgi:hypothetical protein